MKKMLEKDFLIILVLLRTVFKFMLNNLCCSQALSPFVALIPELLTQS